MVVKVEYGMIRADLLQLFQRCHSNVSDVTFDTIDADEIQGLEPLRNHDKTFIIALQVPGNEIKPLQAQELVSDILSNLLSIIFQGEFLILITFVNKILQCIDDQKAMKISNVLKVQYRLNVDIGQSFFIVVLG